MVDQESNILLTYDNIDSGTSFQYKLSASNIINNFYVTITDQNNKEIPNLSDWVMSLLFSKYKNDNSLMILTQIKEYLSYLF